MLTLEKATYTRLVPDYTLAQLTQNLEQIEAQKLAGFGDLSEPYFQKLKSDGLLGFSSVDDFRRKLICDSLAENFEPIVVDGMTYCGTLRTSGHAIPVMSEMLTLRGKYDERYNCTTVNPYYTQKEIPEWVCINTNAGQQAGFVAFFTGMKNYKPIYVIASKPLIPLAALELLKRIPPDPGIYDQQKRVLLFKPAWEVRELTAVDPILIVIQAYENEFAAFKIAEWGPDDSTALV